MARVFPGLLSGMIGIMALLAGGCQTTRVWQPDASDPGIGELRPGDTALIRLRDGSDLQLEVSAVDQAGLTGIDASGARQVVAWSRINVIEVRRTDRLRTTAAVAGTTVFIALAAGLIILLAAFGAL